MINLISCSFVLYNSKDEIQDALKSVLKCELVSQVYLIDNSPTDALECLSSLSEKIIYIFLGRNVGYGSGHNIAFRQSLDKGFKYHIVINPDIYFEDGCIENLLSFMESNPNVGQAMPKILYPDGEIQRLVKLLPTPFDLIFRRFPAFGNLINANNNNYELRDFEYNLPLNSASLSGCFMFLRSEVLRDVGGFDERYFMYLEDYDLTRRIHQVADTMFFPEAVAYHTFKKESYVNKRLLKIHIQSAIKYFNKWGWFIDRQRRNWNRELMQKVRKLSQK